MSLLTLRIATRKSPLALWQAKHVGALIQKHWPKIRIELIPMLTSGDKFLKDKLQNLGGKGLFVKELEEALLNNRADIAVHSMKDVPNLIPENLEIAAICKRDNPYDAFISLTFNNLQELPSNSVIGTASLRRQSQLLALKPELIIRPLRGNVHTRLNKLEAGEFDAIILAAAGLERLNMQEKIKSIIFEEILLPACGQGALGIECRRHDLQILELLKPLHDRSSSLCVLAERHVNALLGGNCHVPLAVFCAPLKNDQVLLQAKVLTLNGKKCISEQQSGSIENALDLADIAAKNLLAKGAAQLLGLA